MSSADEVMRALRIVQRQDEPVDLTVLRAFLTALPGMSDDALRALARYISDRASCELGDRHRARKASHNAASSAGSQEKT